MLDETFLETLRFGGVIPSRDSWTLHLRSSTAAVLSNFCKRDRLLMYSVRYEMGVHCA